MNKIKKVNEDNKEIIFNNLSEAANSIETNMEKWKVQMLIADAMNKHKKAFKCKWFKI